MQGKTYSKGDPVCFKKQKTNSFAFSTVSFQPKQGFKSKLGFSLIEVMIALAIISIASLGYIQYELGSRRAEYDAAIRLTASLLAQDLTDRMRANKTSSSTGSASSYIMSPAYTYSATDTTSPGTANANCIGKGNLSCHGNQMATFDIWEWGQYFQSMMPIGSTATITNAGTNSFTINIQWPNPNVSGGSNQFSVQIFIN